MTVIEKAIRQLTNKTEVVETSFSSVIDSISNGELLSDSEPWLDQKRYGTADSSNQEEPISLDETGSEIEVNIRVPLAKFKSKRLITPDLPRSKIAQEFRSIKRPLLANWESHADDGQIGSNVIVVTSAVEGEGKTFSAVNLALSIAMERGKTVLLVDADVEKATTGTLFGIPSECPGLLDVLLGQPAHIGDVILQTDIPNLRMIAAGSRHVHSTELLASDSMRNVVRELSQRYRDRVILVDAPPILVTNEAYVLASLAGQIVFVVAAESTSHNMVSDALSHLDSKKTVSLLLNKSRKKTKNTYGHRYGNKRNSDPGR